MNCMVMTLLTKASSNMKEEYILPPAYRPGTKVVVIEHGEHFNQVGVIVSAATVGRWRRYGIRFVENEQVTWFVADSVMVR